MKDQHTQSLFFSEVENLALKSKTLLEIQSSLTPPTPAPPSSSYFLFLLEIQLSLLPS